MHAELQSVLVDWASVRCRIRKKTYDIGRLIRPCILNEILI